MEKRGGLDVDGLRVEGIAETGVDEGVETTVHVGDAIGETLGVGNSEVPEGVDSEGLMGRVEEQTLSGSGVIDSTRRESGNNLVKEREEWGALGAVHETTETAETLHNPYSSARRKARTGVTGEWERTENGATLGGWRHLDEPVSGVGSSDRHGGRIWAGKSGRKFGTVAAVEGEQLV